MASEEGTGTLTFQGNVVGMAYRFEDEAAEVATMLIQVALPSPLSQYTVQRAECQWTCHPQVTSLKINAEGLAKTDCCASLQQAMHACRRRYWASM